MIIEEENKIRLNEQKKGSSNSEIVLVSGVNGKDINVPGSEVQAHSPT